MGVCECAGGEGSEGEGYGEGECGEFSDEAHWSCWVVLGVFS